MSNTKKLVILISVISVLLLASVVTLIVVLVSANQSASSNVRITYEAKGVVCDLSATYYYDSAIGKKDMTDTNGQTVIHFNASKKDGVLSPAEEIVLNKNNTYAVFEYCVTNISSEIPMTIAFTINATTFENISLAYYVSNERIDEDYYSNLELLEDSLESKSIIVGISSTKYLYIFTNVENTMLNANLEMDIDFVMERTNKTGVIAEAGTTNGNNVASATGVYAGNIVNQSDLNNTLTNANVLGWYTNAECTEPANFPLTAGADTVLYAEYKETNLPQSNITYVEETDSYVIDAEQLDTTSANTVSTRLGYTPISSTDTVLIIPDMLNGPNGIKPVTEIVGIPDNLPPDKGEGLNSPALLKYNTTIKEAYIGNNIKSIGRAFAWASSITTVHLPEGLEVIKYAAFGASKLTQVVIPDSVAQLESAAFIGCNSLTHVYIGKNVQILNDYTFSSCPKLSYIYYNAVNAVAPAANRSLAFKDSNPNNGMELVIGKDVKVINGGYFGYQAGDYISGMANFKSITFEEGSSLETLGVYSFGRMSAIDIVLPEGLKTIKTYCFHWAKITSLVVPDSVTTIESWAINCCYGLTSFTIPKGITELTDNVLRGCRWLTSIDIPNNITKMGKTVFSGCQALERVTIPATVTSIDVWCFANNNHLTSLTIDPNNPVYTSKINGVECNGVFSKDGTILYSGCNTTTFPEGLKVVKDSAFWGIYIEEIVLPDSIEEIEIDAFAYCKNVTKLVLGANLRKIGAGAFLDLGYDSGTQTQLNVSVEFKTPSTVNDIWTLTASDTTTINGQQLLDSETALTYLTNTYLNYTWELNV